MGVSGTYAVGNGSSGGNAFSTGAVDIKLDEYTLNENNEEIPYTGQYENVIPGQKLDLIQKIKNLAADCYVRAKITLMIDDGQNLPLQMNGMPAYWKKVGEYYYYTQALNNGEQIKIFDQIVLPETMQNQDENKQIILQVTAEAVQASNFNINYESENPWNNIEIQTCIHNNYPIAGGDDVKQMTIQYENNTKKYINVPDNFVEDLSKMMPGDNKAEQLKIENTDKKSAEYFLSIDNANLSENEKNLLKQITIKIKNSKGQEIFSGNMAELNKISLGTYKKSEGDKLTVEIQVPENLGNEFAGINPSLIWKFSAKYEEEESAIDGKSNPKTGDFKFDLSLILFFTATIGLIIVLVLMRAEKKNTKNN